jgi:UDP-N-acetylglucosamine:LPS N-acetylglucosamine transferase
MLHTLRFLLQNAVYFIILHFWFLYYSHFTYWVCYNLNIKFEVCKSVHHRTIQINHQPDVTIFQFIILTFVYSSTSFGRFSVHHQELNDRSGILWFYFSIVVRAVPCSWSGRPADPTTNTAQLTPRYEDKTRGCHCIH